MINKNQTFRYSLIYGAIIGILIVIFQVAIFVFGLMNNNAIGNAVFFLLIIGIMLSIRHFREHAMYGFIDFKKAFKVGFLTALVTGIIYAAYYYFQVKYLTPYLVKDFLTIYLQELSLKNLPKDQFDMQSAILTNMIGPFSLACMYLITIVFWGAVLSLVGASMFRREIQSSKPNNSENNN